MKTGDTPMADVDRLLNDLCTSARDCQPDPDLLERSLHSVLHQAAPSPELLEIADEVAADFGMASSATAASSGGAAASAKAGAAQALGVGKAGWWAMGVSTVAVAMVSAGAFETSPDFRGAADMGEVAHVEQDQTDLRAATGAGAEGLSEGRALEVQAPELDAAADRRDEAPTRVDAPVERGELATAAAMVAVAKARPPQPGGVATGAARAEEQARPSSEAARPSVAEQPLRRRIERAPRLAAATKATQRDRRLRRELAIRKIQPVVTAELDRAARENSKAPVIDASPESSSKVTQVASPVPVVDIDMGGDRLRAELEVIDDARAALMAARPRRALRLLDKYRRRHAGGELSSDERLLRLRVLCALERHEDVATLLHVAPSSEIMSLRREVSRLRCSK